MNKKQAITIASRFYLTHEIPDTLDDVQEVLGFIGSNLWQPYDGWSVDDAWDLIQDLAKEMLRIHELATLATKEDPDTCEFCESEDMSASSGLCHICAEDHYA